MSGASQMLASDQGASAPLPTRERDVCDAVLMRGAELRELDAVEWDSLTSSAIEPNPFFGRAYVRAGIDAFGGDDRVEALAFRRRHDGRLVGLFPFRRQNFGVLPFRAGRSAQNLYQVGGVPLIDRSCADAVVESFLNLAGSGGPFPARWTFPHTELDGPFAQLIARLAKEQHAVLKLPTYDRPILSRLPQGFEAHIDTVIGRKRAKDIQRNLRRLEKLGDVRFERAREPALVARRLEQFLEIERAGWKGSKGTAFLSKPDHARFARLAFSGDATVIDSVLLDDVPIALCVNLAAGDTLYTPKCAFDEAYRKYSAGLMLEYLVIEHFYADTHFAAMNASTTTDGHVIAGLWNESRPMGTLIVGRHGWLTRALCQLERAGRRLRELAKRLIGRARALAGYGSAPVGADFMCSSDGVLRLLAGSGIA